MRPRFTLLLFVIFWLAAFQSPFANAAGTLFTQRVASGLNKPVFVAAPPGDASRLFIVEQHSGKIKILNLATGAFNAAPFLTISAATTGSDVLQYDEQGLLGLAFHPFYASNGYFYVNYIAAGGSGGIAGHTVVERYTVSSNPDVADASSHQVILTFDQPEINHNGGWLGFGADGYLYISTGDGGGANDGPNGEHGAIGSGQDRNSLLGKILRIDVDHAAPYSIPSGNPFAGDASKKQEIWAFGLRNPWRCSFDRANGNLWIGDVGQDAREEIDFNPAGVGGRNYGWRPREGLIQNSTYPTETPVTTATDPITDYAHPVGEAVIGGYVYRGSAIPGLQGTYFYGDYITMLIWSFNYDGNTITNFQDRTAELAPGNGLDIGNISSFGEDGMGELYICDYAGGEVFKIVARYPAPVTCAIFPPDNPWNQDISQNPVDANSGNYIASILTGKNKFLHADFGSDPTYGIPYNVVPGAQPKVPITFAAYGDQSDPGPYPVPPDAKVESGSDKHVLVLDKDNCVLYEMFNSVFTGNGWTCDSGAIFHLDSNQLRPDTWTSADAAGLPILAGLARYDEVSAGEIKHALRFTVSTSQTAFIHPATHSAGSTNSPNAPPMGLRLRLKAGYDISSFTGASKVILTALKKYGMFVADNGSDWYISGSTDSRWDDTDLNQLKTVPGSAFEAVAAGSVGIPGGGGGPPSPQDSSADADHDGFPDELESALGSLPNDASSTPLNIPSANSFPLTVTRLATRINFTKGSKDSILLQGTLPLAAGLVLKDELLAVDIGGIIRKFTLKANGSGSAANVRLKLKARAHKGAVISTGDAQFTVKFTRGTYAGNLADEGLTLTPANTSPQIGVIVLFNQAQYKKMEPQTYSVNSKKIGSSFNP